MEPSTSDTPGNKQMLIPFNKNATQIKDAILNFTFHLNVLLYSTMESWGLALSVKKVFQNTF